jgi:predicted RNase H-like HicB family nuclease
MAIHYTVIVEPEEDGGFSIHCPSLPGCASQGDTAEEALSNIVVAIQEALTAWAEDDMPPPADSVSALSDELYEVLSARAEDGLALTIETVDVEVPYDGPAAVEMAPNQAVPVVLTVPEDPRDGALKRGALRAFVRHSGMTPDQFLDYVGQEAEILERQSDDG